MTDNVGALPRGTGSREPSPAVSAVPASIPSAWTPRPLFSHREAIRIAISDPATVLPRYHGEEWVEEYTNWQARAALEVIMRLVASSELFASAIEARRAATGNTDAVHESAVAKPDAHVQEPNP